MRLDSRSGLRGLLQNLDTREIIRWVRWAEIPDDPEQPGEFEAFRTEPEAYKAKCLPLSDIIYRGKARLRFVPAAPRIGVKPTSPRELAESLADARRRLVEPKLLVIGEECEERGCHRLSCYRVSWEQEIDPQRDADGRLHERAVAREAHCYCEYHARLPRFTSRRGVEAEVAVEKPDPVKIHYEEK